MNNNPKVDPQKAEVNQIFTTGKLFLQSYKRTGDTIYE